MTTYLILEDDDDFYERTYPPAQKDYRIKGIHFEIIRVKTVAEAYTELTKTRFNGAILDLRLSEAESAEGNEVARKIHSDYLIPIAVVSGFLDELDDDFQTLAESKTGLLRSFNKNGLTAEIFDFLEEIHKSGITQIFGAGGELNTIISQIFWNHFGEVLKQWACQEMNSSDRKRVLRHTVSHILSGLQSTDDGNWDEFLPGEVYIWPPICQKETPGQIYEKQIASGKSEYLLLVTPFCDLSNIEERHYVKIIPFSKFPSASQITSKIKKTEHRHHVLPPTKFFNGGVVDFSTLHLLTFPHEGFTLTHRGSLIEPFWRELINRLGAWLGRQGTPELNRAEMLRSIKEQWPVQP